MLRTLAPTLDRTFETNTYVRQLVRQPANVPATRCSECLIQKVWYKRLSGLSRVGDIMEDADIAATTVAANFAFKSYGTDKGIQT
jgi:hypothetical protein